MYLLLLQIDIATALLDLIDGSKLIYDALDGKLTKRSVDALIQDRYSMRCCPQFLGPMVETLHDIARILEIEMNSANDNPLIDVDAGRVYYDINNLLTSLQSLPDYS
ncbi:hypothetical protein I4U23_000038 [Adineta vaga]|nr:hypothetical protein I4U23_000038 [Adineta vaga]